MRSKLYLLFCVLLCTSCFSPDITATTPVAVSAPKPSMVKPTPTNQPVVNPFNFPVLEDAAYYYSTISDYTWIEDLSSDRFLLAYITNVPYEEAMDFYNREMISFGYDLSSDEVYIGFHLQLDSGKASNGETEELVMDDPHYEQYIRCFDYPNDDYPHIELNIEKNTPVDGMTTVVIQDTDSCPWKLFFGWGIIEIFGDGMINPVEDEGN